MTNATFCRICRGNTSPIFQKIILNKYKAKFFLCNSCDLLQSEKPFWLKEAYDESINLCDTGILQRNISLSHFISILLNLFYPNKGKFLDYAGGYGIFTRLMRDLGFDFYWDDPYTKNILARSFEGKVPTYNLITTIESFEHFENPTSELYKLLKLTDNIFFTTELRPEKIPDPEKWKYYGFNHGQHISFYSKETLEFIAKENKLNLYTDGKFLHLLSKKRTTLNPILMSKIFFKLKAFLILKRFRKSKTLEDSDLLSFN